MKAQLALVTVLAIAACKKPEDPAAQKPKEESLPAVKVETGQVDITKMPRYLTLTGSVMADKQSEVAATSPAASRRPTSSAACR